MEPTTTDYGALVERIKGVEEKLVKLMEKADCGAPADLTLNALDSKSIVDRSHSIVAAVQHALDNGHSLRGLGQPQ